MARRCYAFEKATEDILNTDGLKRQRKSVKAIYRALDRVQPVAAAVSIAAVDHDLDRRLRRAGTRSAAAARVAD